MPNHILLTGNPGTGKTTLIRRVLEQLDADAGGFFTEEIREDGARRGFRMVTLDGQQGLLAHVNFAGPPRVGRYGVDIATLDKIATASIRRALELAQIVVIDEIGPMELFSEAFCAAILEALNSDRTVLGTIVKRSVPYADAIKARPDVTVIKVNRANRDHLLVDVLRRLNAEETDDSTD